MEPMTRSRWSYKSLYWALISLATLLLVVALSLGSWLFSRNLQEARIEQQLSILVAEIRNQDEILTMTAMLSSESGDLSWEARYHEAAARLDRAILQATDFVPAAVLYLDQVASANLRLLTAEAIAFDLVDQSRNQAAVNILTSPEYLADKASYAEGLEQFIQAVEQHQAAHLQALLVQRSALIGLMILLFACVFFLVQYAYLLLDKRLKIEKLLSDVARRLLEPQNEQLDVEIELLIQKIGTQARADLVFLTFQQTGKPDETWPKTALDEQQRRLILEVQKFPPDSSGLCDLAGHANRLRIKRGESFNGPALNLNAYLGQYHRIDPQTTLILGLVSLHRKLSWDQTDQPILESLVELTSKAIQQRNDRGRLYELATTDALTGLSNRRHFLSELESALQRCKRGAPAGALLMIDLDHFKSINDRYGHAAGDYVLQHFAQTTQACLRESDLLGRLGGEEFACLLNGSTGEPARAAAERIRQAVGGQSYPVDGQAIQLTVSIGLTEMSAQDKSVDQILNRSDHALYQAKNLGRNQVCVADGLVTGV